MLAPVINIITEKKLVGKRLIMSFTNNSTRELWQGFMPRRKEIREIIGNDLYSIQLYPPSYFDPFNPNREFEKWAAVEVTNFDTIPEGMESIILPEGRYAVFLYKGAANAAAGTYQYIFSTWLPGSEYDLDARPHFEILGKNYKNDDPASEEEIWIPVKLKAMLSG